MIFLRDIEEFLTIKCFQELRSVNIKTVRCIIRVLFEQLIKEHPEFVELICFDILIRDQFILIVRRIVRENQETIVMVDKALSGMSFDEVSKLLKRNEAESKIPDVVIEVKLIAEKIIREVLNVFDYLFKEEYAEDLGWMYT